MILSFLFAAMVAARPRACDGSLLTQQELNACECALYEAADRDLNALWQRIGEGWREEMLPSQRAWLAYRDAQCAFEASVWEGGSAKPMIEGACLETMTRRRIETIRNAHPDLPADE